MMDDRMGLRALASLRIMVGLWLVWQVLPNLDHSFIERLPLTLDTMASANPWGFYRWGLHNVAAPHAEQLGLALSVGQFLVGSALVIGFFSRALSCVGVFYGLNLFFAAGHLSVFHQGFSLVLLMVFAALAVGDAGRFYGLDGWLFKQAGSEKSKDKPKKIKFKNKKQKAVVENLTRELKGKSAGGKQKDKEKSGKK
jgi:uncharacterized membrane protein YphA (DoxX/SURF4 family)